RVGAELLLQDRDTRVVLLQRVASSPLPQVETDQGPMHVFLKLINGEEAERGLYRLLQRPRRLLPGELLRERPLAELTQTRPLDPQPVFERWLTERQTFEEVAPVDLGRRIRGTARSGVLEPDRVDVDGGRVQGDGLSVRQDTLPQRLPQDRERMAETVAGLCIAEAPPQQGGELFAGMAPAGGQGEV